MYKALFFIIIFFVSVSGIVLFKPQELKRIQIFSSPESLEERKIVVSKMGVFLENNPDIMKQEQFKNLPISNLTTFRSVDQSQISVGNETEIKFQGSLMKFKSSDELNQWLYGNVTQDAVGFLRQLQVDDNPEFYLNTLKKISEIDQKEEVQIELKKAYLSEARKLLQNRDGFHQDLAKKAIKAYGDLEKDKELANKIAEELLNPSNKQPDSP